MPWSIQGAETAGNDHHGRIQSAPTAPNSPGEIMLGAVAA
jgi:hypothetical protein